MQESFTIDVDLTGKGIEMELDVFPRDTDYVILLDGVTLTTIRYQTETMPHWEQTDGSLDQETISLIGDKIEHKVT